MIGPIFFRNTIHTEYYQKLIMQFILLWDEDEQDCWIQQDVQQHMASSGWSEWGLEVDIHIGCGV
jgi:hypothetical protein